VQDMSKARRKDANSDAAIKQLLQQRTPLHAV
jgi:hypothetical protein